LPGVIWAEGKMNILKEFCAEEAGNFILLI
jgi:hypothetical protein